MAGSRKWIRTLIGLKNQENDDKVTEENIYFLLFYFLVLFLYCSIFK
jgi:hypothetical protein